MPETQPEAAPGAAPWPEEGFMVRIPAAWVRQYIRDELHLPAVLHRVVQAMPDPEWGGGEADVTWGPKVHLETMAEAEALVEVAGSALATALARKTMGLWKGDSDVIACQRFMRDISQSLAVLKGESSPDAGRKRRVRRSTAALLIRENVVRVPMTLAQKVADLRVAGDTRTRGRVFAEIARWVIDNPDAKRGPLINFGGSGKLARADLVLMRHFVGDLYEALPPLQPGLTDPDCALRNACYRFLRQSDVAVAQTPRIEN